jgi:AraC family transcriptional regulator
MKVADDTSQITTFWDYAVERNIPLSRGWVELRRYQWSEPVDDVWKLAPSMYLFDLALSPRPAPARISFLGPTKSQPQEMRRVLLIPPGSMVRTRVANGRQRSLLCSIETSAIQELVSGSLDLDRNFVHERLDANTKGFEWLLRKICQEMHQEKFASAIVVEAYVTALSVELVRCAGSEPTDASCTGGLTSRRMRLIRDRVYADLPAPSLAELASLCGLTVRHLCRAFKAETGQTVAHYAEAAMIQRAHAMLAETHLSLGEISHRLGFATSSSFARAFRRATGLSPRDLERPR